MTQRPSKWPVKWSILFRRMTKQTASQPASEYKTRTQLGRASPAKGLGLHCWIGLPLSGSQISLTTAVSFILLVCLSVCLLCSGVFVPTLRPLPLASCQPTPAYLGRIVPPRHSHDLDLTLQVINSGNQKPRFQPSSLYPIAGGQ